MYIFSQSVEGMNRPMTSSFVFWRTHQKETKFYLRNHGRPLRVRYLLSVDVRHDHDASGRLETSFDEVEQKNE